MPEGGLKFLLVEGSKKSSSVARTTVFLAYVTPSINLLCSINKQLSSPKTSEFTYVGRMSINYILGLPAHSNSTGSHLGAPTWSGSSTTPPVISAGPITAIVNSGAPHQSAVNQGSVFSLSTPTAAPTAPVQQGALSFAQHLQGEESPGICQEYIMGTNIQVCHAIYILYSIPNDPLCQQSQMRPDYPAGHHANG